MKSDIRSPKLSLSFKLTRWVVL